MYFLFRFRIRDILLAVVLVAGLGASLRAQSDGAIAGQIVAIADGSTVTGARVTLTSAGQQITTTVSDVSGRFAFRPLTPGTYVLSTEAAGFARREISITIEPREQRIVTLPLALDRIETSIQVSGDEPLHSSTHSPSSTVLTSAHLETMPTGQQQSLPDAIVAAAPGMIRGHDDFVHIRGHEIALNPMINGVSFWENPHALFSAGLSPAVVDTVNVMTGAFPAEYGNRFGGVLDVVTKSGRAMRNDGGFAVSGGQAGRRSVAGEFGGHRGRLGYFVFGSLFESDRFVSPPDRRAVHDSGRVGHLFFQADADLARAGSLKAVLMGDGSRFEIPIHPRDLELRPLNDAVQRTRQQSAIVSWTRASSHTLVSASGYQRWSRTRLAPASDRLNARARLDRELATIGGKLDVSRFAGRHMIKAGVDAVRLRPEEDLSYDYAGFRDFTHLLGWPHMHVAGGVIEFAGRETGGQVSVYIQDAIQLGKRVTADVGLRVDRYNLLVSATHASPRVNLALQLGRGAIMHASYNHFFVPPAIEGVLSSSAGLTARISEINRALPALNATTEDQFELGASSPVGPFRLSLTAYVRATDNPVHTTVWPDSRIYSYASFDRARAHGLEAKAEIPMLQRYGVTGYLNYALGRVNFHNPVTGGFVTEAAHLTETSRFLAPMDQTHTLSAGATYRHAGSGLFFGTTIEYGSGTPMGHGGSAHEHAGDTAHDHAATAAPAERVRDHGTASLSVGLDLVRDRQQHGRLSLQVDAENIANNMYLIAQEGEFSPAQYSIPRVVAATIRVRF
jgi:outer membrane receptor protein involved in Fe transport